MTRPEEWRWWPLALILLGILGIHIVASPYGEPFKNNDETRHVMTGVFVHDALHDIPASLKDPKGYTVRYYSQYPALGILVWPPLFYGIEGVFMLVFGPSYFTARLVLTGFVLMSALYTYRFIGERFGIKIGSIATLLMFISPLVFDLSRYCLLEVPCLAWVLASVYHFEKYLDQRQAKQAWLACLLAAAASLTRFDGIVLLPYFGLRLIFTKNLGRLFDRHVLLGMLTAAMLAGPYYAFTWLQYRTGLQAAAMSGTMQGSTGFFAVDNLYLYLKFIPHMLGHALAIMACYGLVRCSTEYGKQLAPFLTLVAATYLTFVPLAEPEPRHAIYWVPAWCCLAALGVVEMVQRASFIFAKVGLCLVLIGTAIQSFAGPGPYFKGYAEAAEVCLEHSYTTRPWLTDGTLTGGFILQARLIDPARKRGILRGDKLFYAVLSDPNARYDEFAKSEADILKLLHDHDPELIVVENPSLYDDLPASQRLRATLRHHPDEYELLKTIPLDTNHYLYVGKQLEVWKKLKRNPNAKNSMSIPVLGLGQSVDASK